MTDQEVIPTDQEVIDACQSDTPWNRARRIFAHEIAAIDQAYLQQPRPTPVEARRMEFEAVRRIAAALGVSLVFLLGLAGCVPPPQQSAQISPVCRPGQIGCLGAYPPYERQIASPIPVLSNTSEPGLRMMRQGEVAVCE